jgi:hypothetical protein
VPPAARLLLQVWGAAGAIVLIVAPFVPEAGMGVFALALAIAIGTLFVHTPRQLVNYCLIIPVVGAWTVGVEHALDRVRDPRARQPAAQLLSRELAQLGVDAGIATYGHFDSALLLSLGCLLPGDEMKRRAPTARWVLFEYGQPLDGLAEYRQRVRLDLGFKAFGLAEKAAGGR